MYCMSELPDDVDELKAFAEFLLDELERTEEQLLESERTVLELKQELDRTGSGGSGVEDLTSAIRALADEYEALNEYVEGGGGPSEGSADALDDATGYEGR